MVELPGGTYPVVIDGGGLEGLGQAVVRVTASRRVVLVTNPVVGALYSASARASLAQAGFTVVEIEVPDGEVHKTVETWSRLVHALLDAKISRSTPVIALGGGVTGDIVGFAAATVLRGVPLIQVPTTLLAMVDSAVGGKTGVNAAHGKNLVGAFHQPLLVFVALATLRTLPLVEVRAGLAEVVKHGMIGDSTIWDLLEAPGPGILDGTDREGLAICVARSALLKARVVSEDERETGIRSLLNFGHTVGHAVEAVMRGQLRHGECVALGMRAELRHAVACARSPVELVAAMDDLLARLGFPVSVPRSVKYSHLDAAAAHDKKRIHATIRVPVVDRIGSSRCIVVDAREVPEMIRHLDVAAPLERLKNAATTSETK